MAPAITRLFDRYEDASAAVSELEAAGVPHHDISLIANNAEGRHLTEGRRDGVGDTEAAEDAGKGAATGGVVGGGAGLLAGLGMLAIPGLGPVVAAGWLVSTAVGAAIGAAAGGAAGGLLGALKDAGHTDEEAHVYAEGVRRGGTLVSVRCESGDHRAIAERVLQGIGGVDAMTRGSDYRAAGWQSFDDSSEPYSADQVLAERRGRFPEDRSFMSPGATTLGQSDDLRTEPVRDGGFADPAARPLDPTERSGF
jgi:hypothetical protein